MTNVRRTPTAAAWFFLVWLMIILSAWSGTALAGTAMVAETDITASSAAADNEAALPEELSRSDWQSIRAAYEAERHAVAADERQPGSGNDLRFALDITGEFTPQVAANGHDVALLDSDGNTALDYVKLQVRDAEGRMLAANFSNDNSQLILSVDTSTARYPITIDPLLQQQAYLKASNTDSSDSFGLAVAIAGNTVVVGASGEGSNATGINGSEADNSADAAGAAYVFVRNGAGNWSQQAYLKASNTDAGDFFGTAVAIAGDTVVIGATGEDSNATGVNGDQGENSANSAGAAYVYVRDGGGNWSQQAYLKASNTDASDRFGTSVAIASDTVVVSALFENSNATGVDGNQGDNSAGQAGAAYVFVRDGAGNWTQQAYLKASNTDTGDRFGTSVAVDSDTVVVGAEREESNAIGIDGDQSDNSAEDAGAGYVFVRDGAGNWSQQAYLKASNTDANDLFGTSVAIAGDTVAVGARSESSNATGVDGNQGENSAGQAGAAYVFVRDGAGNWAQQAYLKASNTDAFDRFGTSVAIAGDTVLVGANGEDSNATGVNGNQSDNSALDAGAGYVFMRDGAGNWAFQAYLKAGNTDIADLFGTSLAIAGDTMVVGAQFEDSNATGVNGNQADNSAPGAGAVYVVNTQAGIGDTISVPALSRTSLLLLTLLLAALGWMAVVRRQLH